MRRENQQKLLPLVSDLSKFLLFECMHQPTLPLTTNDIRITGSLKTLGWGFFNPAKFADPYSALFHGPATAVNKVP